MKRIGVIGQSGEIGADLYEKAERVGIKIAKEGAVLLTGGTSGVMEAASRGAKSAGGIVVGILPGDNPDEANRYIDIPINTGLGSDFRSLVLVHSSDAIIMVGGGNGTLGELSAAYLNKKPVVVLETSGGWADKVRGTAHEGRYLDERRVIALEYALSPEEAVSVALLRAEKPDTTKGLKSPPSADWL